MLSIYARLILERVMGIGPTRPAWKAGILPLNYTRVSLVAVPYQQRLYIITLIPTIVKQKSALFRKIFKIFLIFFLRANSLKKQENIFFQTFYIFKNICYNKKVGRIQLRVVFTLIASVEYQIRTGIRSTKGMRAGQSARGLPALKTGYPAAFYR